MDVATLSPSPVELHLDGFEVETHSITIRIIAKRAVGRCPACGELSDRVHSRYTRVLSDLPWHGIPVRLLLRTRRFFCRTPPCRQQIFTERLPQTVEPYGRKTLRLETALQFIGLFLGGEAGRRLARELGILTSPDTLLRRAKQPEPVDVSTPRCLGVDDWAWRKGQRYGTLLCDLEKGPIVDLLPERSSESLAAWLREHPGVEVISRDRAGVYAEGARQGAPDAVQVADRFHLIRNLTDALQKILEREHVRLRRAAREAGQVSTPVAASETQLRASTCERRKEANRSRRLARYDEVVELKRRGLSHVAIAQQVGLDRRTVALWLQHGSFPERQNAPRPRLIDAWVEHLQRRWAEGARNVSLLFREIRAQGYRGASYTQVRDLVQGWRGAPALPAGQHTPGSVRHSAWLLVLPEEERTPAQRRYLNALTEVWPEVRDLEHVAKEFVGVFQAHDASTLGTWISAAETTPLKRFALGLFSDLRAIRAAIELPWSNGPTEGHINRLKTIKRSMYGRAGFDLLRARLLSAS
jgi:transposase